MRRVSVLLAVLAVLAVVAAIGFGRSGTESGTPLAPVAGPANDKGESLTAQAWIPEATVAGGARSEVRVTGQWNNRRLNALVYRSSEEPDLLRLGWAAAGHLVISEPQYQQDVGRAAGQGDPEYRCGGGKSGVTVTCDTYAMVPKK